MDYIAEKLMPIPAGFIHIPRLPENAVGINNPSMSLLTSARALEEAVCLVANRL
jgi:pyrrolidone-carboxylate peptidase